MCIRGLLEACLLAVVAVVLAAGIIFLLDVAGIVDGAQSNPPAESASDISLRPSSNVSAELQDVLKDAGLYFAGGSSIRETWENEHGTTISIAPHTGAIRAVRALMTDTNEVLVCTPRSSNLVEVIAAAEKVAREGLYGFEPYPYLDQCWTEVYSVTV